MFQVAPAVMLITYFSMCGVVTSPPVTEPADRAATTSRIPLGGKGNVMANPFYPVSQTSGSNYPYYQYPYLPNPYYEYPRGGYYFPLNGYRYGVDGFPQTAYNGYSNYPQYGYQFPNGYPYNYGK
jgi:hypothetical protein